MSYISSNSFDNIVNTTSLNYDSLAQKFIYDQYILIAVIISVAIGIPIFCRLLTCSGTLRNFSIHLSEHAQKAFYLSLLEKNDPSFSLDNPLNKTKEINPKDKAKKLSRREVNTVAIDLGGETEENSRSKSNIKDTSIRKNKSKNVIDLSTNGSTLSNQYPKSNLIERSLDEPFDQRIVPKPSMLEHSLDDPINQKIVSKPSKLTHEQSNDDLEFRETVVTNSFKNPYASSDTGTDTLTSNPPSPIRRKPVARIHSSFSTETDTLCSNPPSPIRHQISRISSTTNTNTDVDYSNPPSPTRSLIPTRRWSLTGHGIWNSRNISEKILSDLINNQSNKTLSGKFEDSVEDDDDDDDSDEELIGIKLRPKSQIKPQNHVQIHDQNDIENGRIKPKRNVNIKSLNFNFNFENGQRRYRNRYRRYLLKAKLYTGMKPWMSPKG